MTIGFWIVWGALAVASIVIILACSSYGTKKGTIAIAIACCVVLALTFGIGKWYYSSTASGQRALKDQESEFSNGVERVIKVIADDGYVLYEYRGKTDVEVHDEYIVFDEKNARRILYRSKTSTLLVEEVND